MKIPVMMTTVLGGRRTYANRIKNLFGSSIVRYWPHYDTSGVAAVDLSENAKNGVYRNTAGILNGVTLSQPGIGDGRTSVAFDGVAGLCDVYDVSLAFPGDEGSLGIWIVNNSWLDGGNPYFVAFRVDVSNFIFIARSTNTLQFNRTGGGTQKLISTQQTTSIAGFMRIWLTWSKINDRQTAYLNGKQTGLQVTGLGSWAGSLASFGCAVGARTNVANNPLAGRAAHTILINREATNAEIEQDYLFVHDPLRISIVGDSISNDFGDWPYYLAHNYNDGNIWILNHAAPGNTIIANMDSQTDAILAGDNPDVVIWQLGTNDDNAGDMTALQAKIESNVARVKAAYPGARQYYLGVLPRWTAVDGLTPVDKSNIRAAQVVACAAQGITHWDTFTVPWINSADTSDGTHPVMATGGVKIATEVIARI